MQIIWELTQSCITSTIAYSSEIWSPGKTENEKINRITDNILKRILMVPQSIPREVLYIETGLLDPEAIRLKNRVLMEHRMMNGTSQRMKRFTTNNNTTTKWAEDTKKAKQELGIDEGDMEGEKTTVKHRVNNKIKEWFKERIEKESKNKSKVQHLLEGIKKLGAPKEGQLYEKTNKAPDQHHLQSQIKNAPSKNNFRNKHQTQTCRACGNHTETQQHVLEECEVLHLVGEFKVYSNKIFSNNTNNLKTTATNIKYILDQLHNQPTQNEGSTTTTTCTTQQPCTARPTKDSSPPDTRGRTQWWWWLNISCMSAANLIVFLKFENIIQISYLCSDTNTTRLSHRFIHVGSFDLTNATPVANGCCTAKWTWEPLGSRCENYVMYFLFNSLWPDNTIWRHRSGSALALVMSWWIIAPNHCLGQCWYLMLLSH